MKSGLIDAIGVALAGWDEPVARTVFRHAENVYRGGSSFVIGSDASLAPMGAALVNGVLVHALDFDDTTWSYIGHPSAVLLPAALALAEPKHASGSELITAYAAGFEVASRVGCRVVDVSETRGWHLTSVVGIFGAAAAAGKLLGLTGCTLSHAFGLAASAAAGLKANFGWMAKPLHAGMAARNGVEAALFADAGVTASPDVFDHPLGFFRAFANREIESDLANGSLAIITDGIAFKQYPSCTGSHPVVEGALELRRDYDIRSKDVEHVMCGVTPEVPAELLYPIPEGPSQARFSMNFAVAVAIVEGQLKLEHFSTEVLSRPAIRELMECCETVVDPALVRPTGVRAPSGSIRIQLAGGKTVSSRVDSAKGNPGNPLSRQDVLDKFESCAVRRLRDSSRVESLADALLDLENVADIADLSTLAKARPR